MKLAKDLFGVRAGNVYPETIPAGEECPPELEAAARELGCIEEAAVAPAEPRKVAKPTSAKRAKRRAAR